MAQARGFICLAGLASFVICTMLGKPWPALVSVVVAVAAIWK